MRLPHPGIALNETYREDGAIIFKHACALGCEGIVSKRLGSAYHVGEAPTAGTLARTACCGSGRR
jgi:ATP-dependent DNA ligase